MSTVIYSYSSNSFSHSTLLSVNPINGQLEPIDYRTLESPSLTKWGNLSNLSIDDIPSIVEDNIDSGLGSSDSEEISDSDSLSTTSDIFNTAFCQDSDDFSDYSVFDSFSQLNTAFYEDSEDFSDSESTASDCFNTAFCEEPATPSTISYLARFRPACFRDYQLLPSIDDDLLDSIAFFTLSRSLDAPLEWSEEERMEFMYIQMRLLWNVSE